MSCVCATASARGAAPSRGLPSSTSVRLPAWSLLLLAVLLAATPAPLQAQVELPALSGRVEDRADILSEAQERAIGSRLERLEADTGAQVVVLTLPTLAGEPIEDFGIRLAEAWRLGREGVDDGVILIVAVDDRQLRIEVGYGLEGVLPDLLAKRIIDGLIVPRFKAGDYPAGIDAGLVAIESAVRNEPLPLPEPSAGIDDPSARGILLGGFLVAAWLFAMFAFVAPGPIAWFVYAIFAPFWFVFPSIAFGPGWGLVALLAWLVLVPILRLALGQRARHARPRRRARPTLRSGPGTGPFGGWGGGGASGGGLSGGGGFSGGGGSFGGGGASGGW